VHCCSCRKVITVNPALVTNVNPGQEGLHHWRHSDKAPASDQLSESWVQIWQRHNTCPILNGLTSILMKKMWKSGYNVGHCESDRPTCVLVVLNGCSIGPGLSLPFKHPCKAHAFFLKHLQKHCQGICRFLVRSIVTYH
jgi:hypothetical protein